MPIIKKKASLINTKPSVVQRTKRPLEKPKKIDKPIITNTPKYYYV